MCRCFFRGFAAPPEKLLFEICNFVFLIFKFAVTALIFLFNILLRFSAKERGKSGGVRVIYIDIVTREHIYLLLAYPKNVRVDLTSNQKRVLNNIIAEIKEK